MQRARSHTVRRPQLKRFATLCCSHVQLVLVFERKGQIEVGCGLCGIASGEWLRSLKLDPTSVPAQLALATCLEHLGDREHAILEKRKALLAAPASEAAHLALGLSLRVDGASSSGEALEQLEVALALDATAHAAGEIL